jgi:hypothetical protein
MKGLVSLIISICMYASPSFHWFAYTSLFVKCSVADKDWGADFRKLSAGSALVGLTLWLDHMQANSPLFFFFFLPIMFSTVLGLPCQKFRIHLYGHC